MSEDYIDPQQANKLIGEITPELFAQVADMFASEASQRLPEILAAHESGLAVELADKAHSIRSSSASVGCILLADRLKTIELTARDGDWEKLGPLVSDLPELLANSLHALASFAKQ